MPTQVQTEPSTDRYLINNTSGEAITITLDPNAFNGDQVFIADINGNAATHPISVTYDGSPVATIGTGASATAASRPGA